MVKSCVETTKCHHYESNEIQNFVSPINLFPLVDVRIFFLKTIHGINQGGASV
jgi:hypothetical protein